MLIFKNGVAYYIAIKGIQSLCLRNRFVLRASLTVHYASASPKCDGLAQATGSARLLLTFINLL